MSPGMPSHKFEVYADNMEAGYFRSTGSLVSSNSVLMAEYVGSDPQDIAAVTALSVPQDYYGMGGSFEGGYVGARGLVFSSGSEFYYGITGEVQGGTGDNTGVYGYADGGANNTGVDGFASSGNNSIGCVAGSASANSNYGVYAYASGGDYSYGVYGTASGSDTSYAGYFVSDSIDGGDVLHAEYQGNMGCILL